MIKETISAYDIERIALFVIEDVQDSDFDIPELIGMYLENTAGCESLEQDEIEHLIITIESKVHDTPQTNQGDQYQIPFHTMNHDNLPKILRNLKVANLE